ncbi:MAG: aldehyde dehydrogenase family protein [bacterium]|nr:aldehyde dehydrogenase family protein [bacterium]MDZ4340889.1 aldehyde dehydrogenase family protein [Candidatus Binatia bacterium]
MTYQSVNPYDGKILKTFEELADKQLETALETAATCFETWRHTTFAERAVVVAKAAAIMHARVDEFARPVTLEVGKLMDEARGEVGRAIRNRSLLVDNGRNCCAWSYRTLRTDRRDAGPRPG